MSEFDIVSPHQSLEKTDDDYQVDDVMLNKVAQKGVKSVEEERERALAIMGKYLHL